MNNNIPIQQVIDQGLKIMQNGQVTDAMYQVWVEYSKSILNMTTKNPSIYSNYLSVILAASNLSAIEYVFTILNQDSTNYLDIVRAYSLMPKDRPCFLPNRGLTVKANNRFNTTSNKVMISLIIQFFSTYLICW